MAICSTIHYICITYTATATNKKKAYTLMRRDLRHILCYVQALDTLCNCISVSRSIFSKIYNSRYLQQTKLNIWNNSNSKYKWELLNVLNRSKSVPFLLGIHDFNVQKEVYRVWITVKKKPCKNKYWYAAWRVYNRHNYSLSN